MTNQASEELESKVTEIVAMIPMFTDAKLTEIGWEKYGENEKEAIAKLLALIRTEKLKLLAEVRERVVGEDERLDIQSDYDKLDVPHPETDRYPGLDGVRQASRNLCRGRQRTALTKLEAEL